MYRIYRDKSSTLLGQPSREARKLDAIFVIFAKNEANGVLGFQNGTIKLAAIPGVSSLYSSTKVTDCTAWKTLCVLTNLWLIKCTNTYQSMDSNFLYCDNKKSCVQPDRHSNDSKFSRSVHDKQQAHFIRKIV